MATCNSIATWIPNSPKKPQNARICSGQGIFSMSRNTNPSDEENINPTANAAAATTSAPAPAKKSWIPAGLGGSSKHGATIDIPLEDPKKRERELLSWEKDLKRRERDIKQREDAMNRGLAACLGWNVFSVLIESVHSNDIVIFLLAVIYAISGCPLSYILWYRPLYLAMRTDSMVNFSQFFVFYSMHVGFCVIAAVAPPIIFRGKALTGILVAIEVLTGDMFVGALYLIGFAFFILESLISIWVLQRVYMYFRGHR